jgi:DNA-binding XRE family transcriptional regulator
MFKKGGYQMEQFHISWAAARVNADLTQDEVAKAMNVTKNTIINWEKYKTEPTISQAQTLCKLYNIPLDMVYMNGSKRKFFCE